MDGCDRDCHTSFFLRFGSFFSLPRLCLPSHVEGQDTRTASALILRWAVCFLLSHEGHLRWMDMTDYHICLFKEIYVLTGVPTYVYCDNCVQVVVAL